MFMLFYNGYLCYCFHVHGKNDKSEFFYDTWNCLEMTIASSELSIFALYPKTVTWNFTLTYGSMLRSDNSMLGSENSELSSFAPYWKRKLRIFPSQSKLLT